MDFTPLESYLAGKLSIAFDVSSNVFSDDAKATPCANDDYVYRWGSSGGISSLDCYQATLSKRPQFKADYNSLGYPAIVLDGTDDWMQVDSNGDSDYTSDFSAFVVGDVLQFATKTYAGRSVSGGLQFGYHSSTTVTASQIRTNVATRGAGVTFASTQTNGVWGFGFLNGYAMATGGLSNQAAFFTGETAAAGISNWYLGTYNGGGLLGNIAVRAFVICQGLTLAQFTAVSCWLNTAYGYGETVATAGASQSFHPLGGA
jgi:hypothetical protein